MLLAILLLVPYSTAQQRRQWVPGQSGLDAGVLPDPGFSYENLTLSYSSGSFKDPNGNSTQVLGSYDVWAVENFFIFVPKFRVLGGHLGMMADVAAANGSLSAPAFGINFGGYGLEDLWVQPLTLGWHLKRLDTFAAYAFVAPTGRYSAGATNNVGSGFWGNHIETGTTVYLTKNKGTTANLTTDWEAHGQIAGGTFTPGQGFTTEWGLGQVIPLDKQTKKLLQAGLIGYDQWQVTANSGMAGKIPANQIPYYSVHALGFQTNFIAPPKNLSFFFKYEPEYRARAHTQGRTIVFGGTWTLRMPRPASQPQASGTGKARD
jgi:hypothetical protein